MALSDEIKRMNKNIEDLTKTVTDQNLIQAQRITVNETNIKNLCRSMDDLRDNGCRKLVECSENNKEEKSGISKARLAFWAVVISSIISGLFLVATRIL